MNERIRFVTHAGKTILFADLSNCTSKEVLAVLDEVRQVVAKHPKASLLTMGDLSNAKVDKNVATRMKEVMTLDRPYVKRSAWVGTETLPKVFYENIKNFSKREIPLFATREEAMEWLVKE